MKIRVDRYRDDRAYFLVLLYVIRGMQITEGPSQRGFKNFHLEQPTVLGFRPHSDSYRLPTIGPKRRGRSTERAEVRKWEW